ncbi:MAG: glycosyltransferase family 2 protein [Cyanobacteria bacterium SIG28]|nr:glycosyltransferase family 2 protein [Cyanobacteria bacterium SIG28]
MVAVSIVIPVYNIEKYLPICLDSIINQTFTDFEVICVNDGSKDNSLKILEEYAKRDFRIKVISQENGGSGSARNNGLKNAQGKYIQFLDGDDYFELQMLETLYNLAEKHNAEIAICSSKKVDDEGNITETKNPNSPLNLSLIPFNKVFNYKDFPEDIFSLTGTAPWNKLYLREMLLKNDLKFPRLTGPDDLCFVHMAIVCAEKIVAIDDEFINYRFNRPNSVQTYRANYTIDIVKASLYIKDFLQKKGIYNFLEKAFMNATITAIRWETTLCNDEQYQKFLKDLKELMPNDWQIFSSALRADFITPEYLQNYIGEKKVYLWGASIFIKGVLEKEENKNPNILGIIDRNEASWGKDFCGYKIYSPEVLKTSPADVLVTIYRNHELAYDSIKKELRETIPSVNVLPNIFVR